MSILSHQAHMIWLLATKQDLLGESGIIMNFNDYTGTWDTDNIPMKDGDTALYHQVEALIEVYVSANEPQTLRHEYSWATKILVAEYKPACLDDVIKTCENLHVKEQHQLKIFLQRYEHLFDGTLGEFSLWILTVNQFIRVHLLLLDQWNNNCDSANKL
jgi:hypothetical protein